MRGGCRKGGGGVGCSEGDGGGGLETGDGSDVGEGYADAEAGG